MIAETWIPIDNDPLLPAALAALGFLVKPNVHLHPDAPTMAAHKVVTWMVAPTSQDGLHDGKQLVPAWRDGQLIKACPAHPLIAAMLALKTRQVLGDWKRGVHGMPHIVIVTGTKFARAMAPSVRSQNADISHHLAGYAEAMGLDHAAAAITCGHGLCAITTQGCSVTSRGAFSQVIPAATLAAAAAAVERNPSASATTVITGHAAGEHPFLYALAAIQQARALGITAEQKDPTMHLNSRSGGKVALVSQSIMEGPTAFKEHVHKHLRQ